MEELRIIVVALEKARAKLKEEMRLAVREAFDNALAQVRLLNPRVDLLYTVFNYIMKDGGLVINNATIESWDPVPVLGLEAQDDVEIVPENSGIDEVAPENPPRSSRSSKR